jgi:hypothetical protein
MKNNSSAVLSGDRKGIVIAVLCFVHCAAGPALLAFSGFSSLIGIAEKAEPVFVLASVAIGTATLLPGYRMKHGRISCLSLYVSGLIFLVVLRHLEWLIVPEAVLAAVGAALIASAHALNLKFSRECRCCNDAIGQQSNETAQVD